MPNKIFVSYSTQDKTFAETLVGKLKNDGFSVWYAEDEILVGDSIPKKISEALESSEFFITILSPNSINRPWVQTELNVAVMKQHSDKGIKILPALLDLTEKELPPLISDMFAAKFTTGIINDAAYSQLTAPIRKPSKADELHKFQDSFLKNIEIIDRILGEDDPTKQEIEILLTLIKETAYNNYFFKTANTIRLFNILKSEGYFKPINAPKPIPAESEGAFIIPEWNVLRYLEKVSEQIKTLTPDDQKKYTIGLFNIIKDVTKYHIDNGSELDNFRTWWSFTKILVNIPDTNLITNDIIGLIPNWLYTRFDNSMVGSDIGIKLLPKFLTDNPKDIEKAEMIVGYITELKEMPSGKEYKELSGSKKDTKLDLLVDDYWVMETLDTHAKAIGEKCTDKVIWNLVKNIKKVFKDKSDSSLTIPGTENDPYYSIEAWESFYESRDRFTRESVEILTFGLKQILLSKAEKNPEETKPVLKEFLKEHYLYFPKMALYIIGQNAQNMANYAKLFWEWLNTAHTGLGLYSGYWGDELKALLKNLRDIQYPQMEILKRKIEDIPDYLYLNREKPSDWYKALYKQEIYNALKHLPEFNALYEEMKKITTIDAELRPAITHGQVWEGPGESSMSLDDLLTKNNQELAKHFSEFRTKSRFEGPTVHGLAEMLKQAVKAKPEKFIDDLEPFIDSYNIYIYEILLGVKDVWNEKKTFNWGKLLDFIKRYVNRPEFWEDKFKMKGEDSFWNADHQWVLGAIGNLIEDGVRSDDWAFNEKHNGLATEILFLIIDELLKSQKPEPQEEIKEPVTNSLNSVWGKILAGHISLALRIARLEDKKAKKEGQKWDEDFKGRYESALNKKINEAYTLFGRYMPNLYYLDKIWVEGKIKEWENLTDETLRKAFITGYVWIQRVYDNLYKLMNAHYKKALEVKFEEYHTNEMIVEHIGIGYLRKIEELSGDGLLKMLLDKWNPEQIEELLSFFWAQRNYLVGDKKKGIEIKETSQNKEIKQRILNFLELLYNRYKDRKDLSKEDKGILSSAGRLALFLPQIDDKNFKWLTLITKGISDGFSYSFFIEYLNDLKDKGDKVKNACYIGKIFLEMLKYFTPDYDKNHIRAIVEFIFETQDKKAKELANEICDIYGRRGSESLLRDIWEKYNTKK